jgi:hypothetical protein
MSSPLSAVGNTPPPPPPPPPTHPSKPQPPPNDPLKIIKIGFNDRESLNRFMHYYNQKTWRINDTKVCPYLLSYNKRQLNKLRRNRLVKNGHVQQRNGHKNKELNSFLQTNFSPSDDLNTLSKLFYGCFYERRKQKQQNEKIKVVNSSAPLTSRTKTTNKETIKANDDFNSDFIRRHSTRSNRKNNGENKRTPYDDRTIHDEETVFRLVDQSNQELMSRAVCISTILRNLSFVPGNDAELCRSGLLLKILARLVILKHQHVIVFPATANDNGDGILNDGEDEDDDDEFECIRRLNEKRLVYTSITDRKKLEVRKIDRIYV